MKEIMKFAIRNKLSLPRFNKEYRIITPFLAWCLLLAAGIVFRNLPY